MTTLTLTVLVASLVGSLHCAAMCGALVGFYSADPRPAGSRAARVLAHGAYNGGRLAAYVALGAAAGGLGATLDIAGALAGFQRIASVAAGGLVAFWGGMALLRVTGVRLPRLSIAPGVSRVLRGALARVAELHPVGRALTVGCLTGALPCGWLWAFVLTAAGSSSAAAGALLMGAFWLGTIPVMLGLGVGLQAMWSPMRRHVPAACAVAMIVLGLVGVAGRLRHSDVRLVPALGISAGPETGGPNRAPAISGHGHR